MIIDLVKYPVLTEKSVQLLQNTQYTFDVDLKLNKIQIKILIQDLFQVNVVAVNTHRPPRKKKVLGGSKGYRSRYKRVIVTLKSGEVIPGFDKENEDQKENRNKGEVIPDFDKENKNQRENKNKGEVIPDFNKKNKDQRENKNKEKV